MRKEHRPRRRAFGAATRRSRSLTLASCCRSRLGVAFDLEPILSSSKAAAAAGRDWKERQRRAAAGGTPASAWSVFFSKSDRGYLWNQLLDHIFTSYFCRMEKVHVTFLSQQHIFAWLLSLFTEIPPGFLDCWKSSIQRIEHPAKTSKISARLPQNTKKTAQKTTRNHLFSRQNT